MAVEVWELAREVEKEQHVRSRAHQGIARPKPCFRKKIGSTQSEAVGGLDKDRTENWHLTLRYQQVLSDLDQQLCHGEVGRKQQRWDEPLNLLLGVKVGQGNSGARR